MITLWPLLANTLMTIGQHCKTNNTERKELNFKCIRECVRKGLNLIYTVGQKVTSPIKMYTKNDSLCRPSYLDEGVVVRDGDRSFGRFHHECLER